MFFEILIGTNNLGKEADIRQAIEDFKFHHNLDLKIYTLKDFSFNLEPEEIGQDFIENALLKAKFYGEALKKPTLADDGGLIIPFLNNEPGVKSRRWAGWSMSDEELINYTLEKMKLATGKDRIALLKTIACFYDPFQRIFLWEEASIEGYIASEPHPQRIKGYPFRSLFKINSLNKYYVELTSEENKKFNHRYQAHYHLLNRILKFYSSINLVVPNNEKNKKNK